METNFSEILIEIRTCLLRKMHLKMSVLSRPHCVNTDGEDIVDYISMDGSFHGDNSIFRFYRWNGKEADKRK